VPHPYSLDLRQRVITACEAGTYTRREIARQFQISEATLYDWLQRWRTSGSYQPQPHGGGPVGYLDPVLLRALVEEQNDRTLAEFADAYEQRTGRRYSQAHLCTALKELGLSRKGRRSARRSI
jgi:transposase